jgi:hypothetical protein
MTIVSRYRGIIVKKPSFAITFFASGFYHKQTKYQV